MQPTGWSEDVKALWSTLGVASRKIRGCPPRLKGYASRQAGVRGVHNIARPGQGGDALNIFSSDRAIVDHCSFTGSMDEMVDVINTEEHHVSVVHHRGIGPLEVLWGKENVFNSGSIVRLKALPKSIPGAPAPWRPGARAPDDNRITNW